MNEMAQALQTFVVESQELLIELEDGLLRIQEEEDPSDTVNAIFRAVHTIKGSAGLFGLDDIVNFTHVVESVLDRLRDGELQISRELIGALLPCRDFISVLIDLAHDGHPEPAPELAASGAQILDQLRGYLSSPGEPAPSADEASPGDEADRVEVMPRGSGLNPNWHLSLRFGPDSLRDGMDPLSFLNYLKTLGELISVTTLTDGLPEAEAMDPETCYLGFEVDLRSDAPKETIESAFDFVRENSVIHILPPHSEVGAYINLILAQPEGEQRLGEILVNSGVLTQRELEEGLRFQQDQDRDSGHPETIAKLGEILVEQGVVPAPIVAGALEKQRQDKEKKAPANQTLRVDASRLDRLIDLVGELVIAGAGANLRASKQSDGGMLEATSEIMRLVEEVRDSALQLRMVPIGTTFSRFQRVVHDLSQEMGKQIELVISGSETEIDKSIVEKIGDPLMHLVRNSMDHGIEPADVRLARGKPASGTLRLNAYHDSGSIVIEVSDDGGGLNRERIKAKAIERGLIEPDRHLTNKEIDDLIFSPGFSTAAQITNISGRGVGMDVVRSNISALRGYIEIHSEEGVGSTFRIHLPLTLAIIDGFLVGVANSTFVVPLDRVVECIELPADSLDKRGYMSLRGEVLPFVRLRQTFGIHGEKARRENVVVVECGGAKAGLVVDELLGEFQTVIKPLGKLFSQIQGISGSTILGTGEVALILDVPALVRHISRFEEAVGEAA